jgi:hypothetical protein
MRHRRTPKLALQTLSPRTSPWHPLVQRSPKRRHDTPKYVFHPLPFPLLDPLRSLHRRKEPVLDDVALDQRLFGVVDKRFGGLGVVFLEEAVEVLAVRGDGDGLGHGICADYSASNAAGGFEEGAVGFGGFH